MACLRKTEEGCELIGVYQVGGVIVRDEGADQVASVGGDDAHLF